MSLFKIRREVMQALDAHARATFHHRVFVGLWESQPETCAALGEERVRDEIDRGVQKAIGYAIFEESDIERFLEMLFKHGFDFDVHNAWARRVLNNRKLGGAVKIGFLDEMVG